MSNKYIPTTWIGAKTVGTADVMNNMEQGIGNAHDRLDFVDEQFNTNAKVHMNETLSDFISTYNSTLFGHKEILLNNYQQIISKEDLILQGRRTKVKRNTRFGHGMIEFIDCKNIVLDGFDFYGQLPTDGSFGSQTELDGKYGLVFRLGCQNITIRNCNFYNFEDSCLGFSDDMYDNNTDLVSDGTSCNILIENCNFKNCRQISMTPFGFKEVIFSHCTFDDFLGELKLASLSSEMGKVKIHDCHFKNFTRTFLNGSPKAGIFIDGTSNVDIHDCTFENMRTTDNNYRLTGGIRIEVNSTTPLDFGNINIHDNTFINCCNDITIYGYDLVNNISKIIKNVNIHDNISIGSTYHVELFGKGFDNNFTNIKIHNNIIDGENGISIARNDLYVYGDIDIKNNKINITSENGKGVYINSNSVEKLKITLDNKLSGIGKLNTFANLFYDSEVNKIVDILSSRVDLYEVDTQPNFKSSISPSTITGWSISGDTSRVVTNVWDGTREVTVTSSNSPLVYKNSTLKANNEYLLFTKLYRTNSGDVYLCIKDSVARDKKYTLSSGVSTNCFSFVTPNQNECIIYPVKCFDLNGGSITFKNTLLINHTKFKEIAGYDLKLLNESLLTIILDRVVERIKRFI